jgi:hypothetical protein
VLLFRGTAETSRVLAVLLVSETPNAVRAGALKEALDLGRELQEAAKTQGKMRLIAPIFSGSQPSLLRALKAWSHTSKDNNPEFEVISGSANGLAPLKGSQSAAVTLHSTIVPSKILRNAAVRFLHKVSDNPAHVIEEEGKEEDEDFRGVALLVESNTGFGRSMQKDIKQEKSQWPMYLPYPMHISRLQAAYTRKRLETEKRLGAGSALLDWGAEERSTRPNPDLVPSLDEAETAPLNDRAVTDITTTIHSSRARFVGIIATDPEDKVFLIQRIKKDCPNVDIFTTSMELFYILPENLQIMRNVLVSTTYPLYPPNQAWTEPDESRRQTFKAQCGQGYYNAVAFHLAGMAERLGLKRHGQSLQVEDFLQEYTPPVFASLPQDGKQAAAAAPRPAQDLRRPPVWIMTIGENGRLVPLAFFTNYRTAIPDLLPAVPAPSQETNIDLPTLGAYRTAALLVIVVVSAVGGLFLWQPSIWVFFGRRLPPLDPTAQPTQDTEQRVSVYRNLTLSAMIMSIFTTLLVTYLLLTRRFIKTTWQRQCLGTILVVLVFALMLCLWLQMRTLWKHIHCPGSSPGGWRWRLAAHLLLVLGGLSVGSLLLFPAVFSSVNEAEKLLFVERATEVVSGYSVLPALLLMCAAFMLYSYLALKRDYLGQRFKVECPYPGSEGTLQEVTPAYRICQDIHHQSEELHRDLIDFAAFQRRHRKLLLVGGTVFVPAFLLILGRAHRTWEGRLWDVVFLTGYLSLAGLVLMTLLRFLAGWKALERILKLIALVPMVRAFDRLPRKTAALFGGYLFARRPRASHLAIPAHILRQLQHDAAEEAKPFSTDLSAQLATAGSGMPEYEHVPHMIAQRLEKHWFEFADEPVDEARRRHDASEPHRLLDRPFMADREYPENEINRLGGEAQHLVRDLQVYWPWHTVADAFGKQATAAEVKEARERKKSEEVPTWVEKAEDFVAIQVIIFLSQFFILLRTMALSMVWVAVLLLMAATTYPFQPERLILYLLLGILGGITSAVLWVLIQINKNEIVSRITQSTPNRFELNWAFAQAALHFVGPIVIIVAAQLSGRLRSIVDPLLDVIR